MSGTSVPSSSNGNIGDYYWNTANYLLYGPKTASGWGSGIALRGPKGDKGSKGDKGDPGTVNVMYSDWLLFHWNISSPQEDIMDIHEPDITLDFINNGGTILSYLLVLQTSGNDTLIAKMHSIPGSISGTVIGYGAAGDKFDFDVAIYLSPAEYICVTPRRHPILKIIKLSVNITVYLSKRVIKSSSKISKVLYITIT